MADKREMSWSEAMGLVYHRYDRALYMGEVGEGRSAMSFEEFIRAEAARGVDDAVKVASLLRPCSLEIEYDAHDGISFSVAGRTEEQREALEALEGDPAARMSSFPLSITLDWFANTRDLAAAMRQVADWLDRVGEEFPDHEVQAYID